MSLVEKQMARMFIDILDSYSKLFNNASKLDGLHNKSVELTSKIIANQFINRKEKYGSLLAGAINNDDIEQEYMLELKEVIEQHYNHRKSKTFVDANEVINFAIQASMLNVESLTKVKEIIVKSKYDREELYAITEKIIDIENKDLMTLNSFLRE